MSLPTWTRRSLLAAPLLLAACSQPAFNGVDLTGASWGRELSLPDTEGRVRTLADYRGKVLVLFFGYTQCPDVCPTTLSELRAIKEQLGKAGEDVLPVFITVDPERDTPQLLRDYMAVFGGVALRPGSAEELQRVAREFKVVYQKVPGTVEGQYSMDHSAQCLLFDRQGRLRVYSKYGTPTSALLADLKLLLSE
jgi:protein SCO1/2